jgi:inorganic phosphate transporter, PiT family
VHFFDIWHDFGAISYANFGVVVWVLIILALFFDFLNGFHDAANSVATVVSTRVLTPRAAVIWAAFFNFIAFLIFNLSVARAIGTGIIDPAIVDGKVIAATLIGACAWDIITWYYGLPTSSSHALIGGLVGAALIKVGWPGLNWVWGWPWEWGWKSLQTTICFIVLAPAIGIVMGLSVAVAVSWIFRNATFRAVDGLFRKGQFVSAALYSLGHGGNDAQKTMGIIFILMASAAGLSSLQVQGGYEVSQDVIARLEKEDVPSPVVSKLQDMTDRSFTAKQKKQFDAELKQRLSEKEVSEHGHTITAAATVSAYPVPTEVVLACHVAMGLGTLFGGWRIVKTMGQKLVKLRPVDGFCAETAAAGTLLMTIYGGVPVSTTHTITGAIVGVGSARYRYHSIRWGVARRVVWAWVLTIPGAAIISLVSWQIMHWLG